MTDVVKTVFKIIALIVITPVLLGAVVFGSLLFVLFGIIGSMYDAETSRPTAQPPKL